MKEVNTMIKRNLLKATLLTTVIATLLTTSACGKKTANNTTTDSTTAITTEAKSVAVNDTKTGLVTFDYTDADGNTYTLEGKAVADEKGDATIEVTDANGNKVTFTGKSTTTDGKLSVSDIAVKNEGTLVKADGSEIKVTAGTTVAEATESTGENTSDIAASDDVKNEIKTAKKEETAVKEEEKKDIINLVVTKVNGRIPIVLGVGGNCTRSVVEKLKNDNFDGIDAILSVVPYYNKPSQEGIYQHYKAIAEATTLPIVLYNVPGRTGVNMTAETTLRIAREFKNVIAVKEASGNITQMDDIIKNKPANFNVISGDDGITFPLITLGAVGVISVIGNAFPREFSRMVRLALAGDYDSARTIHHSFTELFSLLFIDGNPAGAKSMLNAMGFIENKLRLPLVPTRITTFEKIRDVLRQLSIKC